MTAPAELVEAMARALRGWRVPDMTLDDAETPCPLVDLLAAPGEKTIREAEGRVADLAAHLLQALSQAGWVVVPREASEASEAMLNAGGLVESGGKAPFGYEVQNAAAIWKAMLSAMEKGNG